MEAALGLALASVVILVAAYLIDQVLLPPEDKGHVTAGWKREQGWWR